MASSDDERQQPLLDWPSRLSVKRPFGLDAVKGMKKELAIAVSTALAAGILSPEPHPHIHQELPLRNTTSEATVAVLEKFFRYWVPGNSLSKCFSTREYAIKDAKSHGHSDPIIETVNRDGMSAHQTLIDCPYPDLFYCGIRI
jgi:hypothetical protein